MGSAFLMEIPIAMILLSQLLPYKANRLANIIAAGIVTLVNGFATYVAPLVITGTVTPAYPEYLFFATIETVCTLFIIWKAWTWPRPAQPMAGTPTPEFADDAQHQPSRLRGKPSAWAFLVSHDPLRVLQLSGL